MEGVARLPKSEESTVQVRETHLGHRRPYSLQSSAMHTVQDCPGLILLDGDAVIPILGYVSLREREPSPHITNLGEVG
jgi:hypothetical protein